MTKKILFITPPYFNIEDTGKNSASSYLPCFTIPYGILSMASYMKAHVKKGFCVELLDLNLEAYKIAKNRSNQK